MSCSCKSHVIPTFESCRTHTQHTTNNTQHTNLVHSSRRHSCAPQTILTYHVTLTSHVRRYTTHVLHAVRQTSMALATALLTTIVMAHSRTSAATLKKSCHTSQVTHYNQCVCACVCIHECVVTCLIHGCLCRVYCSSRDQRGLPRTTMSVADIFRLGCCSTHDTDIHELHESRHTRIWVMSRDSE